MLADRRCEALEVALAAEIAASILDVAIRRCRRPALEARDIYILDTARLRSARRHLRDAPETGPFGVSWFRERVTFYRGLY